MDIQALSDYIVVCNYENITKASEALHISQSALSRRIQALESELGVELLKRTRNRIEVTEAGRAMMEDAIKIIARHEKMTKNLMRYRNEKVLTVGFTGYLYSEWLVDSLIRLRTAFPDLEMSFIENNGKRNSEEFRNGNIDILHTARGEIDGMEGVECVCIEQNDITVWVPRGHSLWNRSIIELNDLRSEKICIRNTSVANNLTWAKSISSLNEQGMQLDNLIYCSTQNEMLLYVLTEKCLGLAGLLGTTDRFQQSDRIRNIRLNVEHVDYGDIVLAYRTDEKLARDCVNIMAGKK